jgi:hypothetical protein
MHAEYQAAQPTITMSIDQPPKKRGCFFYGCIVCLALLLFGGLVVGLVGWYTVHQLNALVDQYTDTAAMPLPKVDMPPEELAKLKARVAEFKHALDAHTNTPPLVLTSREINALMADNPQIKSMNLDNTFYVDLEGDHIDGEVSLPLDNIGKIPFVHTAGRYLNGKGEFAAEVTNATLSVTTVSLEVKGKPLPPQFMASLSQKNLADSINQNPTNTAAMARFESIEVKDSALIIRAKSQ